MKDGVVLVDKSPRYSVSLSSLLFAQRLVPRAKILVVARDGRDHILSYMSRNLGRGDSVQQALTLPELMLREWHQYTKRMRECQIGPGGNWDQVCSALSTPLFW